MSGPVLRHMPVPGWHVVSFERGQEEDAQPRLAAKMEIALERRPTSVSLTSQDQGASGAWKRSPKMGPRICLSELLCESVAWSSDCEQIQDQRFSNVRGRLALRVLTSWLLCSYGGPVSSLAYQLSDFVTAPTLERWSGSFMPGAGDGSRDGGGRLAGGPSLCCRRT